MGTTLVPHIIPAVQGFFRSIALRGENSLQDTLRLLTLWFKFGAQDEVSHAITSGFSTVEVDTWLEVIPQVYSPCRHFTIPSTYLLCTDYCAHPDPEYKHPEEHHQFTHGRWQAPSTGADLSAHCGIKVSKPFAKGRRARHHGSHEATQPCHCRTGALTYLSRDVYKSRPYRLLSSATNSYVSLFSGTNNGMRNWKKLLASTIPSTTQRV